MSQIQVWSVKFSWIGCLCVCTYGTSSFSTSSFKTGLRECREKWVMSDTIDTDRAKPFSHPQNMEIQFSSMTLHILAFWTLMIHSGRSTRSGCEKPPWLAHERPRGYNSAMKGCERSTQRWTAASNIFQRIEEDLLQMNVVSYNTLISCYSQEGSAWLGLTWCNLGGEVGLVEHAFASENWSVGLWNWEGPFGDVISSVIECVQGPLGYCHIVGIDRYSNIR